MIVSNLARNIYMVLPNSPIKRRMDQGVLKLWSDIQPNTKTGLKTEFMSKYLKI